MTQQHPITPPPELVEQLKKILAMRWCEQLFGCPDKSEIAAYELVQLSAQWGADRQLKADAEWLDRNSLDAPHLTITPTGKGLVEAMRSKPPSLKEQALAALERYEAEEWCEEMTFDSSVIRRALEQLDD